MGSKCQINFRINEIEKTIIAAIAKERGYSVAEFSKQLVMSEISSQRVDLAFKLLKEGKIYRKKCWILSGLEYPEFMREWTRRGAEEMIPVELLEKSIEAALKLDIRKFLRNPESD